MNNQENQDYEAKKSKPKDHIVAQKYQQLEKIGCGSFGSIYLGVNIQTQEKVAIKREPISSHHPQIGYEAKLYRYFQVKYRTPPGFPGFRWFGADLDDYALVMDLLGPSLEDLFNYCNRKFSLKTTLMIADQLMQRIEFVHNRHYIHRDLKPDNFLIGLGKKENVIHIIDFGLAKRYRDPRTSDHIPYSEQKSLTGTARYASIHTHLGREQSRRDDLESLGYVLMYFVRGSLPWQGLQANTKREKYEQISQRKIATKVEDLTRGYPTQFRAFFRYIQGLKFDERPDYRYLRSLLKDIFDRRNYVHDFMFDWTILSVSQKHLYVTPSTLRSRATTGNFDKLSIQQIQQQQITLMHQQQAQQAQAQYYPYVPPPMPHTAAQQQVHEHMQANADPNGQMFYANLANVPGGVLTPQAMDPITPGSIPTPGVRAEGLPADMSRLAIEP